MKPRLQICTLLTGQEGGPSFIKQGCDASASHVIGRQAKLASLVVGNSIFLNPLTASHELDNMRRLDQCSEARQLIPFSNWRAGIPSPKFCLCADTGILLHDDILNHPGRGVHPHCRRQQVDRHVMYAIVSFDATVGPNAMTFVLPVEIFETRYRSTLHGFCAASGAVPGCRVPLNAM